MTCTFRTVAAMAFALGSASALACGYCIEDRVAAVYDQALVDGALARRHEVAFLGIEARAVDAGVARAARGVLERVRGVDKGSARARAENAAIALTFDPSVTSLDKVVEAANRPLAGRGVTLSALRVIDASGKLREP
jgi:hypothetical protein